jgi:hypothetical protein
MSGFPITMFRIRPKRYRFGSGFSTLLIKSLKEGGVGEVTAKNFTSIILKEKSCERIEMG